MPGTQIPCGEGQVWGKARGLRVFEEIGEFVAAARAATTGPNADNTITTT